MKIRRCAALAAFVAATGCGFSPPTTPAPEGRALVQQVLEQWRNGVSIGESAAASPPISVSEQRWEAGWILERYEITSEACDGYQARCAATLWLKEPTGKASRENAEYVVTVAPRRTVVRVSEGW